MRDKESQENLTTTEAAEMLGVLPDTVRHWIRAGKLKARKPRGSRDWQINREVVEKIAAIKKEGEGQ